MQERKEKLGINQLFPNKWKRRLAKTNKGLYSNQGKWISEHEYGKEWYYNKY